jgi:hypothetical protein
MHYEGMIYGYDGNDPRMTENTPLLAGQIVVMACLSLLRSPPESVIY